MAMESLADLPDDCLIKILELLSLEDFWTMRRTCSRLEELTVSNCPVEYKTWKHDFADVECGKVKLKWMLTHMHDIVQHLELREMTADIFSELNSCSFPQVQSLKLHLVNQITDVDKNIAQLCPNLKHLAFEGLLTDVQGFAQLPNLETLEIYCDDGNNQYLENATSFFNASKLRKFAIQWSGANRHMIKAFKDITGCADTLQELAISGEFFGAFLNIVNTLKALRIFSFIDVELFEGEEGTLDNIFNPIASRVIRYGSSFDYGSLKIEKLRKLCNLDEWIINDRCVSTANPKMVHSLFSHLRVIQCWNKDTSFYHEPESPSSSEDEGFSYESTKLTPLELIAVYNNLEILAVPQEWIGDRFHILELLEILKQQKKRTKPLELRCLIEPHCNESDLKKNLGELDYPNLLKITLQQYPPKWPHWDSITRHYLQLELVPLVQ